jgi:methyl acetate hydrolase
MRLVTGLLIPLIVLSCTKRSDWHNATDKKLTVAFNSGTMKAAIMASTDKEGHTDWFAYGPAIWKEHTTVAPDNIFRIFSMTKAIASVAAMQLVEQGKIKLDEPLNELMPNMAAIPILDEQGTLTKSDDPITLKQLLTHTSGFGYSFNSERLANFKQENWPYEDNPRLFKPGSAWHYGTSLDWAGKVIEKVSGKDLETYLRDNVTGPLKMNSTWFNVPENLQDKIVSWGSRDSTGRIVESERLPGEEVLAYSAGSGLYSSPEDYLRFLRCLLNYGELEGVRILKKETVELMLQDHLPANVKIEDIFAGPGLGDFSDPEDRYGLGWAIEATSTETVRPRGAVYWGGAANSYFTLDVPNNVAIVYFTNFFPFNDKESEGLYRMFEKEVYARGKASK